METPSHAALKRLARAFLVRVGCCCAACEVLCPVARHRLDAAGYADDAIELPQPGERAGATLWSLAAAAPSRGRARPATAPRTPTSVIIECKRSRSDFFRDGEDIESLLLERDRLRARRAEVEEQQIRRLEPHLRRSGSSLFPELETWEYTASRVPAYLRVKRELAAIDRRLYGHAKFSRVVRWRLADRLLVLAPSGLLRPGELPEGWGLLEVPRLWIGREARHHAAIDPLVDLPLRLTTPAPAHEATSIRRQRLLRNIAVALSRACDRTADRTIPEDATAADHELVASASSSSS